MVLDNQIDPAQWENQIHVPIVANTRIANCAEVYASLYRRLVGVPFETNYQSGIDIECCCVDEVSFPGPYKPLDEIISITITHNNTDQQPVTLEDRKAKPAPPRVHRKANNWQKLNKQKRPRSKKEKYRFKH